MCPKHSGVSGGNRTVASAQGTQAPRGWGGRGRGAHPTHPAPPPRRYVPHPRGSILGSLSQHHLTGTRHCHFMGGGASTLLVTVLLRVTESPETHQCVTQGWDGVPGSAGRKPYPRDLLRRCS